MPKRDDVVLLHDIPDAIHQIELYLYRVSYRRFVATRLLQDGIAHQLETISEAARNLSEDFREQHSEMPWQDIIGMRNRIAHAYFSVDVRAVWDTTKSDLPTLRAQIEQILGGAA